MEILIIEDDRELAKYIESELLKQGHSVTTYTSAKKALKYKLEYNHDLIILDLLLEDERGEDLVTKLRKQNVNIPILVLSSLSNVSKKVELLKSGVDDYLTKPFDINELIARIDALYRRHLDNGSKEKNKEKYGDLIFHWKQNKIIYKGKEILLTKKEVKLLKLLVRNKGEVINSRDIIKKVWDLGSGYHSNILQALIKRLRKKFIKNLLKIDIKNIHGVGYSLVFPEKRKL